MRPRLSSAPRRVACSTWLAVCTLSSVVTACGGSGESASASTATAGIVISTAADADALVPPLVTTTAGKQVVDLLFDHLADPHGATVQTSGDAGYAPRLARAWRWSGDSLAITFDLDSAARWHDGRAVTAADVAFSFGLYRDPAVASIHARGFDGIDSVTALDERTVVARWSRRHPEQFHQLVANLAVLPKHLLDGVARDSILASSFASHPVGSGRYRFERWDRKRQLVLVADSANYRGRPRFSRVIWTIAADPNAATAAVLSGQADVLEVLRGDAVARAAATPTLRTVEYGSLDYGYLAFNQRARGPVNFAVQPLRVALSAAVDRAAVVRNALDSLGRPALGPVTRAEAFADTTLAPIAFDTVRAAAILDSLGWRWNAAHTGRERGGRPLAFSILVPASSGTRKKLAVLLQAQYAAIGAKVEIDAAESADFAARMQRGDFQTALTVWRNDPSPASLRQSWGSAKGDDVGANFGRYASAAFDATVDSAVAEFEPGRRKSLFQRAYRIILADAPAVWLYEPRNLAAVRATLAPAGMRADAWLAGLADWSLAGK